MENKKIICLLLSFLFMNQTFGQSKNGDFDKMLSDLIDFEVPTITVTKLKKIQEKNKIHLFDAREEKEYNISHLPGAKRIGYDNFSISDIKDIPKNETIVVYCTVGYRSGKVVQKLQKAGYTNVYNLYGSIIEWTNQGNKLENKNGQTTTKVHTYNKDWAKWLKRGIIVY